MIEKIALFLFLMNLLTSSTTFEYNEAIHIQKTSAQNWFKTSLKNTENTKIINFTEEGNQVAQIIKTDKISEIDATHIQNLMLVISSYDIIKLTIMLNNNTYKNVLNKPYNGGYIIHFALKFKNSLIISMLLNAGADPYKRRDNGNTALQDAISSSSEILRSILTKNNSGVNMYNFLGFTAMHMAIMENLDKIELLLNYGGDIDIQDFKGRNLLHLAILYKPDDKLINFLIKNGIDINAQDIFGNTASHMCVLKNDSQILEILAENGAKMNLKNSNGMSVIHIASGKNLNAVQIIIKFSNDSVNHETNLGHNPLHISVLSNQINITKLLLDNDSDPNKPDVQEYTPLHIAVTKNYIEITKILLKNNKTNINSINIDGDTPLIMSAMKSNLEICKMLIEFNADVNVTNNLGMSILHIVSVQDFVHLIPILINKNVDINARDIDGETPLSVGIRYLSYNSSKMLLDLGADPNIPDFMGRTPLHTVGIQNDTRGAKILLENQNLGASPNISNNFMEGTSAKILKNNNSSKININIQDMRGMSPIYVSLQNIEIVQILLKNNANPFLSSASWWTALHEAANKGYFNSLKLILEKYKNNINIPDRQGLTPLFAAVVGGHVEIVEYLLQNGANPLLKTIYKSSLLHSYNNNDSIIFNLIYNSIKSKINKNNLEFFLRQYDIIGLCPISYGARNLDFLNFLKIWNDANIKKNEIHKYEILHSASIGISQEIIHFLLKYNINSDFNNNEGITPIMMAAEYGKFENFQILLQNGSNLNKLTPQDKSLLHFASSGGNIEIINIILNKTQIRNIDLQDSEGYTPLMNAILNKNENATMFLLQKNSDPYLKNIYNEDSIQLSVKNNRTDIFENILILNYNYDMLLGMALVSKETNEFLIKYLLSKSSLAELPIFYSAATGDHISLSNEISEIDPNFRPIRKFPHLMKEFLKDYDFFMNDLKEDDSNIEISPYLEYLTPLDMAVLFFGDVRIIKLLLKYLKINIYHSNKRKTMWTTLDFSMYSAKKDYKSKLISRAVFHYILKISNSTFNSKNEVGWGLGHKAAWIGNRDVFLRFETSGVDFGGEDYFGRSPLHIAAAQGQPYVVDQLLMKRQLLHHHSDDQNPKNRGERRTRQNEKVKIKEHSGEMGLKAMIQYDENWQQHGERNLQNGKIMSKNNDERNQMWQNIDKKQQRPERSLQNAEIMMKDLSDEMKAIKISKDNDMRQQNGGRSLQNGKIMSKNLNDERDEMKMRQNIDKKLKRPERSLQNAEIMMKDFSDEMEAIKISKDNDMRQQHGGRSLQNGKIMSKNLNGERDQMKMRQNIDKKLQRPERSLQNAEIMMKDFSDEMEAIKVSKDNDIRQTQIINQYYYCDKNQEEMMQEQLNVLKPFKNIVNYAETYQQEILQYINDRLYQHGEKARKKKFNTDDIVQGKSNVLKEQKRRQDVKKALLQNIDGLFIDKKFQQSNKKQLLPMNQKLIHYNTQPIKQIFQKQPYNIDDKMKHRYKRWTNKTTFDSSKGRNHFKRSILQKNLRQNQSNSNLNPNSRDRYGFTPLHLSLVYSKRRFFTRLSEVSSDIPFKVRFVERSDLGNSLADRDYLSTTLKLVDGGSDLNAQDSAFGWTPLHWAAINGDILKVSHLLALGAEVSRPARNGVTPMYLARLWHRRRVYQLLREWGGVW